jgi:hypothetical protein
MLKEKEISQIEDKRKRRKKIRKRREKKLEKEYLNLLQEVQLKQQQDLLVRHLHQELEMLVYLSLERQ